METMMILLSGVLITVATYLMLSKSMIRVILGTAILTHAAHILLITMGGLGEGSVPLVGETPENYVDALPQALILTSIVINFGVTAFFLVLVYRSYQQIGSANLNVLRSINDE